MANNGQFLPMAPPNTKGLGDEVHEGSALSNSLYLANRILAIVCAISLNNNSQIIPKIFKIPNY